MVVNKQKTIKKEISLSGVGLHTGCKVSLTLKAAEVNSGITFIRVDVNGTPAIKAAPENILREDGLPRCTSIGQNNVAVYTVEHLMSVLSALGISNLIVEIDAEELPGLDGSALNFLEAVKKAGVLEQEEILKPIVVHEPISAQLNGASIHIIPDEKFKISYTLDYEHPFLGTQFYTTMIDQENFEKNIAPSRTFCLEEEVKELKSFGLGKGANTENTLVVGDKGVKDNKLRFKDEFARHKVLDFIGDLFLLGRPIQGHVYAIKSGHTLNIELLRKISQQHKQNQENSFIPQYDIGDHKEIDIKGIMKILPHRYPFLLVDRVIELEKGKKAVGLKNLTINDNFFQGHFPSRPIMPGVLMVEAMAQTAGVVVLTSEAHRGKVAFFMATDKVKFRKVVTPGDQLVMEVEVVKDKARMAKIRGISRVNGEIVAEADMVFSFTDASYLG